MDTDVALPAVVDDEEDIESVVDDDVIVEVDEVEDVLLGVLEKVAPSEVILPTAVTRAGEGAGVVTCLIVSSEFGPGAITRKLEGGLQIFAVEVTSQQCHVSVVRS